MIFLAGSVFGEKITKPLNHSLPTLFFEFAKVNTEPHIREGTSSNKKAENLIKSPNGCD